MLSLSKIGVSESAVRYYAKYALEQGETEGIWIGKGAAKLEIEGGRVSEDGLSKGDRMGERYIKKLGGNYH